MAKRPKIILERHSKPLEDWQIDYLTTGNVPERATLEVWEMCFQNYGADAWEKHRDWILRDFIRKNPGRRPWAWWRYDAPRWARKFGAWFDGTLPEPRLRVGGAGTVAQEKFPAIIPRFNCGIPKDWHEIDEHDPPTFEAEASYLKRHGLLSKTKEKRLKPGDFEPESCLKYMKTYD
ncbi:MAG TPA: hypothetical protein VMW95_09520 [Desulfobacterales bacterium]|nr:hypothetical protein [Desulfobacterales bacterium]